MVSRSGGCTRCDSRQEQQRQQKTPRVRRPRILSRKSYPHFVWPLRVSAPLLQATDEALARSGRQTTRPTWGCDKNVCAVHAPSRGLPHLHRLQRVFTLFLRYITILIVRFPRVQERWHIQSSDAADIELEWVGLAQGDGPARRALRLLSSQQEHGLTRHQFVDFCFERFVRKVRGEGRRGGGTPLKTILPQSICTICCESLIASDSKTKQSELRELDCGHVFHRSCIEAWLRMSTAMECPNCRQFFLCSHARMV